MRKRASIGIGSAVVGTVLAVVACTSESPRSGSTSSGVAGREGNAGGTGGVNAPAGGEDASSSGVGGSVGGSSAGSGGSIVDPGGTAGADASIGAADGPTGSADGGPSGNGFGGVAGLEDLSTVKKSAGCGMPAPQTDTAWHTYMVSTPMTRLGPLMRAYHLKLPPNYDNTKPYRLIFQGTNCGGCPTCVMGFDAVAGTEGVIQVALERNANAFCFDDQSPMSIEYPFIEAADVDLRQKLCFDEHRVFVNGHSSGAWVSNEMGCVYGSAARPGPTPPGGPLIIRATAPHSGGLSQGGSAPPCSNFPTPGMWTHNHDDTTNVFMGTVYAINRALKVNGCMGSYGNSPVAPYPAPGTNDTCHIYTSCPKEFPVILCDPATGQHEGNKFVDGNWQFFKSF